MVFSFDRLRRWPDAEAVNLHAVDAADRLILDTAAPSLADAAPGTVVVVGDHYGALTLGAIALHGARSVRVHQDSLVGEHALAANAASALPLASEMQEIEQVSSLNPGLFAKARVVLLHFGKSLGELDEVAGLIATHADPAVVVVAGGMQKHMTTSFNEVLLRHFEQLDVSLARQKARVLTARAPREATAAAAASPAAAASWPAREFHADLDLWVCAHGGAFAGTSIDIGTRALLAHLDELPPFDTAMDLGCGTGVLAAMLARRNPAARIIATDQSAAAVASATATFAANAIEARVFRDDSAAGWPEASVDLVVLNPPFHSGTAVHSGAAERMFATAARVLKPGGELWVVYNSHLGYAPMLRSVVGATREIARTPKFTVTASRKRDDVHRSV